MAVQLPGGLDAGPILDLAKKVIADYLEEYPEYPALHLKTPNGKWRAVSSMQKAIRRGIPSVAVRMAAAIYNSKEGSYAAYRMAVIAVEDIGAANPDLVLAYLYGQEEKNLFRKHGQGVYLAAFARAFARSAKDRNGCDLLVASEWHPEYDDVRAELATVPARQLQQVYADALANENILVASIAASYIAGTKENPGMVDREGSIATLANMHEDEYATALAILGMKRQGERHPVMLPIIRHFVLQESDGIVEHDDIHDPDRTTKALLSCALDMHTLEGKKAIAYFMKSCEPLKEFLTTVPDGIDKKKAVGLALFRAEGHQCRNRLQYPANDFIQKAVEDSFQNAAFDRRPDALAYGSELFGIVRANLDTLNAARDKVMTE